MEGEFTIMVNYPDLSSLDSSSGISGMMALPNASYPYYWAWIIGGIWVIMVLTMYFKEKEGEGRTRILSSMAVSSLAIIFLSTIGTALGIISMEIMVYILVFGLMIIGIWFIPKKN